MKKKQDNSTEDRCFVAERQYQRMMDRVNQGIADKEEIVMAIEAINIAHYIAIKQNKRHLLI